jgi:hypothetical protein
LVIAEHQSWHPVLPQKTGCKQLSSQVNSPLGDDCQQALDQVETEIRASNVDEFAQAEQIVRVEALRQVISAGAPDKCGASLNACSPTVTIAFSSHLGEHHA